MNDPESYEHVETSFSDKREYAVVIMKYRVRNAFGGKVIGALKAKVSWDCKMLSVIETL
jgi:hypothetical protein